MKAYDPGPSVPCVHSQFLQTFKIGSASDDPRIRGGSHLLFPAGRGPPREPQLAPNVVYRGYRLPIGRQRDDESGARPSDTRNQTWAVYSNFLKISFTDIQDRIGL
ncbi:hypothetical protein H920_05383 [Fukomys damarensis]|uniref:Uncharacterized protein n=1 Tax=Fukomys damarensis TaxID=885580 RepID=A0A091DSI4_FUKDA|nr:hypothetical protein H920_05383 [Fukomys damarensis]